jgi:hypothetical protein
MFDEGRNTGACTDEVDQQLLAEQLQAQGAELVGPGRLLK